VTTALILRPISTPDGQRTIRQRESDGYVCLTDICQAAGKLYADWRRTDWAGEYLEALALDMGIPISKLIDIRQSGRASDAGTWGHLRIALRVAQWCSPSLAVQVDKWLEEWHTRGRPGVQALLAQYLAPAVRPWQRRFEREFYYELYRLWGKLETFPDESHSGWGIWTAAILDRMIYARTFPKVVMEVLRQRNPPKPSGGRRYRNMQLLAEDLGDDELKRAIDFTLHFLRVAQSPEHFWRMLDTVKPLRQGLLPFKENFGAEGFGPRTG
jgi:hypothetical protein